MKTRSYLTAVLAGLACVAIAAFSLITRHATNQTALASEGALQEVFVEFEGPWAFAPDPADANSVIALAPKTKSHRDLTVQTWKQTLPAGVYDLSIPPHGAPGTSEIDVNILRAKIDPQNVQHVLDSKSGRYAIRLPKPDAYVEALHVRGRAGAPYPPDPTTEKDYVTSVSLRYSVSSLNGFSLAGTPDAGAFAPLLLTVHTPILKFSIEPSHDAIPAETCHTHEREAFRDLTRLVNVTLFLDFPGDPGECLAQDPQNPHPVKAEFAPAFRDLVARGSAGFRRRDLLAMFFFFGDRVNCEVPVIVASD